MSDIVICDKCKGQKQIPSMGGMSQDCLKCQGLGHILMETATEKLEKYYNVKQQAIRINKPKAVQAIKATLKDNMNTIENTIINAGDKLCQLESVSNES